MSDLDWLTLILKPELLSEKLDDTSTEDLFPIFVECCKQLFFLQRPLNGGGNVTIAVGNAGRKINVLRFLTLQLSAHLDWDLKILDDLLPLPLQFRFFEAWFSACCSNKSTDEIDERIRENRQNEELEPFVVFIYCRWILKTVVNLNIPGGGGGMTQMQQLLQMTPEESKVLQIETDQIISRVTNNAFFAVKRLETFVERGEYDALRVPKVNAFTLNSQYELGFHPEDRCKDVDPQQHRENLLLDLTSYYFFIENYERSKHFCSSFDLRESKTDKPEVWNSYYVALGIKEDEDEKKKTEKSTETSPYRAIALELKNQQLNLENLALRAQKGWSFNMDLLRTSKTSSALSVTLPEVPSTFLRSCFTNHRKKDKIILSRLDERKAETRKPQKRELISELFRELNHDRILEIIQDLHKHYKKSVTINRLTSRWQPADNNAMRNSVKNNPELADFLYVLNCKLTQLKNGRHYQRAESLYSYLQTLTIIPTTIVQCESLTLNLLDCAVWDYQDEALTIRCKDQIGKNNLKDAHLSVLCLARLLNAREWDFLASKITDNRPIFSFSRALALLALNYGNSSDLSKNCKTMVDVLTPIFLAKGPQKRSSSSSSTTSSSSSSSTLKQTLLQLVLKIHNPHLTSILGSYLVTLYNVSLDDANSEIGNPFLSLPFDVTTSPTSINPDIVVSVVESLASSKSDDKNWTRTLGEISYSRREFASAMKFFMETLINQTNYFLKPFVERDDKMISKMIKCSSELGEHCHGLVLCQFTGECDYSTAFRSLEERQNNDAMDGVYPYIWDITILEYAVTMHAKRGELHRKRLALESINHLELNTNNNEEILSEAASNRRNKFLRRLASFFL